MALGAALALLAGLAVVTWVTHGHPVTDGDGDNRGSALGFPIVDQQAVSRLVVEGTWHEAGVFAGSTEFVEPNALNVHGDDLFVFDYGKMVVYRFDKEGDLLGVYGSGPGGNPGEIMHITGVSVHPEDGRVLILDTIARTVTVFSEGGEYASRFHTKKQYWNIVAHNDVVILLSVQGNLFDMYDYYGKAQSSTGNIVREDGNYMRDVFGYLRQYAEDGFVYVPSTYGYVFYMSTSAEIQKVVRTVEQTNHAFAFDIDDPVEPDLGEGVDVSKVFGVQVDNTSESLYIAIHHAENNGRWLDGYIDKYDLNSGTYVESYHIPRYTRGAAIVGDGVIVLDSTRVKKLYLEADL